jgi:hypothetical protein
MVINSVSLWNNSYILYVYIQRRFMAPIFIKRNTRIVNDRYRMILGGLLLALLVPLSSYPFSVSFSPAYAAEKLFSQPFHISYKDSTSTCNPSGDFTYTALTELSGSTTVWDNGRLEAHTHTQITIYDQSGKKVGGGEQTFTNVGRFSISEATKGASTNVFQVTSLIHCQGGEHYNYKTGYTIVIKDGGNSVKIHPHNK